MHDIRPMTAMALIWCLLLVSTADAQDRQRCRYCCDFGLGLGLLGTLDEDVVIGVQSDLRIGYGFTDQFRVHYTGKQFWHKEKDGFLTVAHPSVGVTYYLEAHEPSFLISGGAGFSIAIAQSGWHVGGATGSALQFGVGYQFHRRHTVECHVVFAHYPDIGGNIWNVFFTLNALSH